MYASRHTTLGVPPGLPPQRPGPSKATTTTTTTTKKKMTTAARGSANPFAAKKKKKSKQQQQLLLQRRREEEALGNVWESEAMRAYKTAAKDAASIGAVAPAADLKNAANDSDWVLVQQSRDPIALRGDAHEVVLVPDVQQDSPAPISKRQAQREADLRRSKGQLPLVTREMTDTEYNRVFKRPLPHNYGRANTRPVVDENYLRTFNVRAAISGGTTQVYDSALAALAAGPPTSTHLLPAEEIDAALLQQSLRQHDQQQQGQEEIALAAHEQTSAGPVLADSSSAPLAVNPPPALPECQPPLQGMTFGKPSKDRRLEPSMFEILSWEDPNPRDVESVPRPGANALDPRNYATLPPSHIQLIPFAGTRNAVGPIPPGPGAQPLL